MAEKEASAEELDTDDSPDTPFDSSRGASVRELRRLRGKALRKTCPRSAHDHPNVERPDRDPMTLLEESNRDRVESLLPIRFTRMAESAFAFFRGTSVLQAKDLQGSPNSGIQVQCCGDCHLMNFGGFATPERTLAFDINDFDETHPGPFEWDIKRLTVSFVLAARWLGFSASDGRDSAHAAVREYRNEMARYAQLTTLETWYSFTTYDQFLKSADTDPDLQKLIRKRIKKAQQNTAEHVFEKITTTHNGEPQITIEPPLLYRTDDHDRMMSEEITPFFERYRESLSSERRVLFDRFRIVDAAVKVVGVGSVGTRCYIALLMGHQDDPLFLQVKEARNSVLAGDAEVSAQIHNGERVVSGQRLMQAASDIFLGWTTGAGGRDFYVRQLRDMKVAPDLTDHTPKILMALGKMCGRVLARAHAKAGDATSIYGYLGSSETFDNSIANYAVAYADQVEKDYEEFRNEIRKGRFRIETMGSDLEAVIR